MEMTTLDLIDALTDNVLAQINQEIKLGRILRGATDDQRTEIAYYMQDRFMMHPDRPPHAVITTSKIEAYIAYHLRKAQWHLAWEDLLDEADAIEEMDHNLFPDDVTMPDDELLRDLENDAIWDHE